MSKLGESPGGQTAVRTLKILKLIGQHNADGLTARHIREALGEERSAVQRALQSLISEGLVQRGTNLRHFHLGVEAIHLGQATLRQSPLVSKYQFALQKIARVTGETVFLSVRLGNFSLCLSRVQGTLPVPTMRARVGDMKVLGTNAGGLALLSTLPDAEIKRIHEDNIAAFRQAGLGLPAVWRHVAQARQSGYVVLSDAVSKGVTTLGIIIGDRDEPFASAAIASPKERMNTYRAQELAHILAQTLAEVV